ncbi:MAG: hypothetical protein JWM93_2474 [Frankiales bacterium]|nr:hypothetical protein [Frankiales bacterium]
MRVIGFVLLVPLLAVAAAADGLSWLAQKLRVREMVLAVDHWMPWGSRDAG